VARWNGQTRGEEIFSVAQHSLLVEALFSGTAPAPGAAERLVALLHDAPEYVVGDMISPFKAAVGGHYRAVEDRLLATVHLRFALPARVAPALKKAIKSADRTAAYFEATALAGFSAAEARILFGAPAVAIDAVAAYLAPWRPVEAQRRFLRRFQELESERAVLRL